MITFLICLVVLVGAYFTYGKYLDKVCKIDPHRAMPSQTLHDGVDYVPLPRWRVFLIQLLNIAGTGPIFGAILGACYGPVVFLWITLGGIFMGGVMDYVSGVMITRRNGLSVSEVVGRYLGRYVRLVLRVSLLLILVLVGVVFTRTPAAVLHEMVPQLPFWLWIVLIFAYFFLASVLRVDRIIGRVYPLFALALLLMVLCLFVVLCTGDLHIPELTSLRNCQLDSRSLPILPTLCITVACGAISGFHATQSPIMARCLASERDARPVFFGAMLSESVIALIWAAVAMAFFHGPEALCAALADHGNDAAWAVNRIARGTLGTFGAVLAILGVVAAPITSGDTAFRSARLILADMMHLDQRHPRRRQLLTLPVFAVAAGLFFVDFDVVWRYFSWTNQVVAVFVLWGLVVYLKFKESHYGVALFPALFMTFICWAFVFISPQFFCLPSRPLAYGLAAVLTFLPLHMLLPRLRSKRPEGE